MSKESKEIREIMEDIKQIITESYVFDQKSEDVDSKYDELGNGINDLPLEKPINSKPQVSNIDSEVKEIRKIALNVISKITPMEDPEAYKLVKSVWDSCDKFLTKDKDESKKPQNQNNN